MKLILTFILSLIFFSSVVFADSFELTPTSLELNLSTGSFGTSFVTINNTVNETLKINVTGDENTTRFMFFEDSVEIAPLSTKKYTFGWFVPIFIPVGEYKFNLTLNQTRFPITLTARDESPPTVRDCILDKLVQNRTLPVEVTCNGISDSHEVLSVMIRAVKNESSHNFTLGKETFGIYGGKIVINEIGEWNMSVLVWDSSGNKIEKNIGILQIVEYIPIVVEPKVDFTKIKFDDFHRRKLATLLNKANISVFVEKLNYSEDVLSEFKKVNRTQSFQARLELPCIESKVISENNTYEFLNVCDGDVYLVVKGMDKTAFSGRIIISILGKSFPIDVKGEITYFNIPEREEWLLFGREQSCVGEYKGAYEDSSLLCELRFPIDQCEDSVEDCILASPKSIITEHEQLQRRVTSLESSNSRRGILTWVFGTLFLLTLIGLIVYYRYENPSEED